MHSPDAITWTISTTDVSTLFSGRVFGIGWNGLQWVAGGSGGHSIIYSSDGDTWTAATSADALASTIVDIAWNGNYWIATGNTTIYSPDGINWSASSATSLFTYGSGVASRGLIPYAQYNAPLTKAFSGPTGSILYYNGQNLAGGSNFYINSSSNIIINTNLVPAVTNTYTLGLSGSSWNEIFIGPGSLNISGPEGVSAQLGSDQNGIAYTAKGFATPFINIGPSTNTLDPGSIGGWFIGPTGTYGEAGYDIILQQKFPGSNLPAGFEGPVYSLTKGASTGPTGEIGHTGTTGSTGPSLSYVAGNEPYVTGGSLYTTTIAATATAVYEIGPITTLATTKLLLMANVCLINGNHSLVMTVGRATTSAASIANSSNIVADASMWTNPPTSPSYYMAAFAAANQADGKATNLSGFSIDTPGAGTFYYTIWMSSSTSHTYAGMTASLTALSIMP